MKKTTKVKAWQVLSTERNAITGEKRVLQEPILDRELAYDIASRLRMQDRQSCTVEEVEIKL